MNITNPNIRSIEPSNVPDDLALGVLEGLARPIGVARSWGFVRTSFMAGFSFGLLPLIELPRKLGEFAMMEYLQFSHLAEWLRTNSAHPQTAQLKQDAEAIGRPSKYRFLTALVAGAVTLIFFFALRTPHQVHEWRPHAFWGLMESTWRYRWSRYQIPELLTKKLYLCWCVGLGVGYLLYFKQLMNHTKAVRLVVDRFNAIAVAEGLQPVVMPMTAFIPGVSWVGGAVVCGAAGAWWGIPMMIAAGAHRNYIWRTSLLTRGALALRLRAMILRRQPGVSVTLPVYLRRTCANAVCRASASDQATYCTRCGKRLSPPLHVVA